MGISPQFADINGDGHKDMLSGCYEGAIYVAWGSPAGLCKPEHLLDREGDLVHTGRYYHWKKEKHVTVGEPGERTYSVFPYDWDADGDLDLVTGTGDGGLYLRFNEGNANEPAFATEVQPILVDEGRAKVDRYAMPVIADWDGDGRMDLLTGSQSGVYWFRNIGSTGKPKLQAAQELVCGMYSGPKYPAFRFQICVTDFDGDGDLDLLVGDKRSGKRAGFIWLYRRVGKSKAVPGVGNANPVKETDSDNALSSSDEDGMEEMSLDEVPEHVKKGAEDLFPGLTLSKAKQEWKGGQRTFVLLGEKDGWQFRIRINDQGKPFQFEMGSMGTLDFSTKPRRETQTKVPDTPRRDVSSKQAKSPPRPDLPNGAIETEIGLKMLRVEAQSFWMGSPQDEEGRDVDETRRRVEITNVYWLGETEVTQSQWTEVMGSEPWSGQLHTANGPTVAATYVSWHDAIDFCRRLTKREATAGRLPEGYRYALPTEAEWELACRAGSEERWSFGNDLELLGEYAVFEDARSGGHAHNVKSRRPNAWGLYDMHGNVWEWCADEVVFDGRVRSNAEKLSVNPLGTGGPQRVCRGGSYRNSAVGCRSAIRDSDDPNHAWFICGFRVALVARPGKAKSNKSE